MQRRACCATAAILMALAMAPASVAAQAVKGPVIRGWVADTAGQPVPFARVAVAGLGERVADDSGRFLVSLARTGIFDLNVRRVGFSPLFTRASISGDTVLRLVLRPLPAALAKVEIEAEATSISLEMSGFYDRLRDKERATNTGHFILPEEIEKRVGSVTQVVTGIPGLRVAKYRGGGGEFWALFGNSRKIGNALCPMTIYLDRVRLSPLGAGPYGRDNPPVDINSYVTLRDVAAIEVYTRTNMPAEFALLNGTCGVVLIWTK